MWVIGKKEMAAMVAGAKEKALLSKGRHGKSLEEVDIGNGGAPRRANSLQINRKEPHGWRVQYSSQQANENADIRNVWCGF